MDNFNVKHNLIQAKCCKNCRDSEDIFMDDRVHCYNPDRSEGCIIKCDNVCNLWSPKESDVGDFYFLTLPNEIKNIFNIHILVKINHLKYLLEKEKYFIKTFSKDELRHRYFNNSLYYLGCEIICSKVLEKFLNSIVRNRKKILKDFSEMKYAFDYSHSTMFDVVSLNTQKVLKRIDLSTGDVL